MTRLLAFVGLLALVGCEPDPPKTQPSAQPSATPRPPAHPELPARELRSVQCWVPVASALERTLPVHQPEKPRMLKGLYSREGYEARVWEASALGTSLCVVTTMPVHGDAMPSSPRVAKLPNMKALPRRDNVLPPSDQGINASELIVAVPIQSWGETLKELGEKLEKNGKEACAEILKRKPDGKAMAAAAAAFIDSYVATGESETEPSPPASVLAAIRKTCLSKD